MLVRFGLKNHRSIRDYQEISLVATKLRDNEGGLLSPIDELPAADNAASARALFRIVPIVALYGANASGKSTVLDGLRFFSTFIKSSQTRGDASDGVPHHPFLLDETSQNEVSTYDADIIISETRFHYGFTINREVVTSEWLYSYPVNAARQARTVLLHRDIGNEEQFYFGKGLRGENKQISRLVRPNSLFLSAAAQNAHEQLTPVYDFFKEKLSWRSDHSHGSDRAVSEELKNFFGKNEAQRNIAVNFLKAADIGVLSMDFSRIPIPEKAIKFSEDLNALMKRHWDPNFPDEPLSEMTKVNLAHAGEEDKSYKIPLEDESAGTKSLLQLLGPTLNHLTHGGVLIVDELNTTLHPLVTRELISMFSTPSINKGKAQLIFSTHDTNVLAGKALRRDQIWFAEKDRVGATHIYSMAEIKVRKDENLESGYLAGKFGAIPYFGSLNLPPSEANSDEEE